MDIKISVIVPVYNVEKYLPKCLESIINQSFKDIEIICVNDGSTDSCLNILKSYQKKDKRIVILEQENQGVASSRNNGLNLAKGEYIYFVDSDDWLDENLLTKVYKNIIENDTDIVSFDCYNVYEASVVVNRRIPAFLKKYKNEVFNFNDFKDVAYQNCTAWSKVYKKDFLLKNNLKFPDGCRFSEDAIFWFDVLAANPKISLLNECLYYYRKRQDSLTQRSVDLLEKQWQAANYRVKGDEQHKLLFFDYMCRAAIYGYSAMPSLSLVIPYEKSLVKYKDKYKNAPPPPNKIQFMELSRL